MNNKTSTPVALGFIALLAICVAAVATLVVAGKPVDTLIALIATTIVPTSTMIFLGKRVDQVGDNVESARQTAQENNDKLVGVTKAVNGNLDAKFRDLERRLLASLSEPSADPESKS